jgi:hypothetical protein
MADNNCYVNCKAGILAIPEKTDPETGLSKSTLYLFPRFFPGEIHEKRSNYWLVWFEWRSEPALFKVFYPKEHMKEE